MKIQADVRVYLCAERLLGNVTFTGSLYRCECA